MNLTVFLPFNINSTEVCNALYITEAKYCTNFSTQFQGIISRLIGAAWENQVSAVHKDVIAQTFLWGVVGLGHFNLSHAFGVSLRTYILLVCAEPLPPSLFPLL